MTRKLLYKTLGLPVLAALFALVFGGYLHGQAQGTMLTVTVTNLTRGEVISPAVVATHNKNLQPLFTLGAPASAELAAIAEDAVNTDLVNMLNADSSVGDVQTVFFQGGPIPPGKSASVEVNAPAGFEYISVVGMLVTTNDAFFALNGVRGALVGETTYFSPAYDSGSEANNELCAFIPGPPCGNAGVRDIGNAEGFVHIHAGVHGIGDLVAADHDWRNPVAKITILTNTQPTIVTVDQSGSGPGAITDAQGVLISASNPAQRGQVVVVYATDLGPTDPQVPSGEVTPLGTLASVVKSVTAIIGGVPAIVDFAGLTPGFIGLYQVNARIPQNAPLSDQVDLYLVQDEVRGNTVTTVIR